MRNYKYYDIILGLFVGVLLISNVASAKILLLGPFTFDGGTILFPISYIFGDILTEVYGYHRSRRVIWTGFATSLLMSITLIAVGALPPAPDWGNQEAFQKILGLTPRIVAASMVAYFAGEFSNSYVLAKLKVVSNGRWLWFRTITSTIIGEGVDTTIFCLMAFWGILPSGLLWEVILSNYVFKVGFEVAFTPATYAAVNFLKRNEGIDIFDRGTNFNPFAIKETAP